jgi:hypothetical protein
MDNLERLLVDVKDSLEREFGSVRAELREGFADMKNRFDNQAARLNRQGGLLNAGSRWSSRMDA